MAALVPFFFVRLRRTAVLSIAAAAVATLGCGSDGTSPDGRVSGPPFRVVAGGGTTDTVQARLMQPLVVEIHDTTGHVAHGKTVRFEALPPDDQKRKSEVAISLSTLTGTSYTSFSADLTDSNGQAR